MKNRLLPFFAAIIAGFVPSLPAVEWTEQQPEPHAAPSAALLLPQARPDLPQLVLDAHAHPARVFAWADEAGLQFEILVTDDQHDPITDPKRLWQGDCLYLDLDGWGNNPDDPTPDHNDGQFFFALGASGASGKVSSHGNPALVGELPGDLFSIDFDGTRFRYRVTVPWFYLNSAPAHHPHPGLALTLAHKAEEANAPQEDLNWGDRANLRKGTRALQRLAITATWPTLATAPTPERIVLPLADSTLDLPVSYRGTQSANLYLEIGDKRHPIQTGQEMIGRIGLSRHDLQGAATLRLIVEPEQGQPLIDHRVALTSPQDLHDRLQERIGRSDRSNPIAALHLDSLASLAADVLHRNRLLHRSGLARSEAEAWGAKQVDWLEKVLAGFPESGFDLPRHLADGMPLYLAFASNQDGSLQFATLQVPADYQPDQPTPLVLYLHGAGPRVPVDFLITAVDNSHQDTLWNSSPEARETAQREVLLLAPFGRGTQSYQGMAEEDVWQALDLTESLFNIAPDQRYLTGFSMGCHGTFQLASRQPGRWAALVLAAGFYPRSSVWNETLYEKLRDIPKLLWCGEEDQRMLTGMQEVLPQWQEAGLIPAHVEVASGINHAFPYADFDAMLRRAFQFRQSPAQKRP